MEMIVIVSVLSTLGVVAMLTARAGLPRDKSIITKGALGPWKGRDGYPQHVNTMIAQDSPASLPELEHILVQAEASLAENDILPAQHAAAAQQPQYLQEIRAERRACKDKMRRRELSKLIERGSSRTAEIKV